MGVADQIVQEAQRQGVDPQLAIEVAMRESSLNQAAIGSHGEIGVFQLMQSTATGLGVDPTDVAQNIQGGVTLLNQLLARYGNPAKALAAYNWGPGSPSNPRLDYVLATYGANWFAHIPSSTQAYIQQILGNVQTQYAATLSPAPAIPFVTGGSTMTLPAAIPQPADTPSLWGTLAIAAAVIFGIGFVLSET